MTRPRDGLPSVPPGRPAVSQRATEPAPPVGPMEAFENLLEAEERAARTADAEALLGLQAQKAHVLRAIEAGEHDPVGLARLAERARRNLPLVRSLVALHRALLGEAQRATYGQRGTLKPASVPPPARFQTSG